MSKSIDLEVQYHFYLKMVGLSEADMHETQKIETKRAFMGGCSQMLNLLVEEIGGANDDEAAFSYIDDLYNQAKKYWIKEVQTL